MLDNLVTITLDKKRHLRLTLKGMLEFEKITGKSLLKGFKLDELSLTDSAALIWACLLHEDIELTYDAIITMIDINNLAAVMETVTKCLNQSLVEAKADGRPLARKSRAG